MASCGTRNQSSHHHLRCGQWEGPAMHIRPEELELGNHGPSTLPPGPGGPEPTLPIFVRPQPQPANLPSGWGVGGGHAARSLVPPPWRAHLHQSFVPHSLAPHPLVCPISHPTVIYGALRGSRPSARPGEAKARKRPWMELGAVGDHLRPSSQQGRCSRGFFTEEVTSEPCCQRDCYRPL